MREFKNKTLALILASSITVVGSFAAEKYSNTLMGLNFESQNNNEISMVLETKTAYSGNVTPIKKDSNTYILMLPNINSSASTPDLQNTLGNIESVSIRTMPYTTNNNGYTRITVKTLSPIKISGKNKIYIPTEKQETLSIENKSDDSPKPEITYSTEPYDEFSSLQKATPQKYYSKTTNISEESFSDIEENIIEKVENNESEFSNENYTNTNNSHEPFLLILGILLIITLSVFFYLKAKNRLTEIAGEKLEIDVEEEKPKKEKIKKIKDTIKTLDKMYSKTAVSSIYKPQVPKTILEIKKIETPDIVDLDKLFEQEQIKNRKDSEEEENLALEEFLSGFSFQEEQIENKKAFDEKIYEEILNRSINFTKEDINCINELLFTEINIETFKNIEKYAVSNPIKTHKTQEQVLENLITDYAIFQDIQFKQEDINTLKNLMNVELDSDFISDLKTNPERTLTMQKEMEKFEEELKKPAESVVLKVKDILPDLSEELKKQGLKRIESNYKPQTVYFQEGYDVNIMSVKDELTKSSIKSDNKFSSKNQTITTDLIDNSYEVSLLKVSDLPDLEKALKEDQNIKPIEKKQVVNEGSLLKNLENVKFKDFSQDYDKKEKLNNVKNRIMQKIADTNTEKKFKNLKQTENITIKNQTTKQETSIKKCTEGNLSYSIISTTEIFNNMGCHLAKNENGYAILTYKGDNVSKIKDLNFIKKEYLQSRLSEKLEDGTLRYIIKVDTNKFIIDIKDDNINYVMDL